MSEHAAISPSSLFRHIACPGSLAAGRGIHSPDTDASRDGTASHWMLEQRLSGTPVKSGVDPSGWRLTAPMIECALQAEQDILEYTDGSEWFHLEQRLPVGAAFNLDDELWGTADVIISHDPDEDLEGSCLTVLDYKSGIGPVAVKENWQLLAYAIGAREKYGSYDWYRLVIVQPRVLDEPAEWIITDFKLDLYRRELDAALCEMLKDDAPRIPGEAQCQWCVAAGNCKPHANWALGDVEYDNPAGMTDKEIGALLDKEKAIASFFKALNAEALNRLEVGKDIPGYKMVEANTRRAWFSRDNDEILAEMRRLRLKQETFFPKTPVSPSQAVKLGLTPRQQDRLIVKPSGSPTIAKESDRRPALVDTV